MTRLARTLALPFALMAGCGFEGSDNLAIAQTSDQAVQGHAANSISVPVGGRNVLAYLSENQRALILDPYDDRGHDQLKRNLPVSSTLNFASDEIVVVEFQDSSQRHEVERALMEYIRTGVVQQVAYVAQTTPAEHAESFLITNSATVYPTATASPEALERSANDLGYSIVANSRFGHSTFQLVPLNPLESPLATVAAARKLADMDLIEDEKTRSDLVQTEYEKRR
jgi:hypothetical protein